MEQTKSKQLQQEQVQQKQLQQEQLQQERVQSKQQVEQEQARQEQVQQEEVESKQARQEQARQEQARQEQVQQKQVESKQARQKRLQQKQVKSRQLQQKQVEQKQILEDKEKQTAMRVSTISIIVNVVLSALKMLAGLLGHSGAMISDAVHSLSDVFSTIVVMIGVSISKRTSDEEHQYGHDRMECVAAILLAILLFAVGIGIGADGVEKILHRNEIEVAVPGMIALIAAIVSIAVKEWMYHYTKAAANHINSGALMADAWHHRSDAMSSIGALIGIAGARIGYPILDPVASLIICFFIGKAAYDIFKDAIDKMVDKSCDDETIEQMKQVIMEQQGVEQLDLLQTRLFGAKIYVDIEIAANGTLTLQEAHDIAQHVHDAIEEHFPLVKHCMVHVNPII